MMKFTVQAQLGTDLGQSRGTLFEVKTADGRLVIGAGCCDVFNTQLRTDRDVVQFFVRRTDGQREFTPERLPRPDEWTGAYLHDFGGEVFSGVDPVSSALRVWDPTTSTWQQRQVPAPQRMRLGDGVLAFGPNQAWYNGRLILDAPEQGAYTRMYYAAGHLCFYHTWWGGETGYRPYVSDETGFSRLYACPWTPSDGPIDLSRAKVKLLSVVGATTFAWGQRDGHVLTCSNLGGVHVFDGAEWRTLREEQLGVSYQVYTMVRLYDKLLLGQYPTGMLFEYDGESLTLREGWPPRLPGASPGAREAQTATIWGGELLVGVWPWGELWRHNPDCGQWFSMGRMFSSPQVHETPAHPWENECREAGLIINAWGQRVASLIPYGDSLLVSTSSKGPMKVEQRPAFISDEALAEYGAVTRLHTAGCVSAPVRWAGEAIELEFLITEQEMVIRQGGVTLASTALDAELAALLQATGGIGEVTWGNGVYGPFGSGTVSGQAQVGRD